ncbi:MAG: outer membrane beta-barrel protein [Tannerella sp.]|nr:outer membrane beta-barrel protein [Tannerella sp.]
MENRNRLVLIGIGLFALLALPVKAQQNKVEIKGAVVEKNSRTPIEAATIRLLSGKDSTMKAGVASGNNGRFSLKNITPGTYLLHVTYVGYEPVYQPLQITGRSESVSVGNIEMDESSVLLGEAVVTAKAVEVIVKADTVEYNADSYKVTEGSMLEDLLKKMPGVEVGSDGSVTINGKQIKKILVDGKEFFSEDPKVATKNLPAKMVEKVQTYDRKSDMAMMTGFDDGDEEAVINLTVRPGMKQGWFGNAFAGYGSEDRYEGNFMVNRFINNEQFSVIGGVNNTNNMGFSDFASTMFSGMGGGGRRGMGGFGAGNGITQSGNIGANFSKEFSSKLTLGGNVRYSHSDNDAESENETENILPSGNTFDFDKSKSNTINDNAGFNLRMTWKPDTLTQVIFRPDFSYSKTNQDETNNSYTMNSRLDSVNTVESDAHSEGNGYNVQGRLEASRKLNSKGRVLSVSLSGGTDQTKNDSYNYSLTKYFLSPELSDDLIDQQIDYDNTSRNYRGFVSWVEPVGRNNSVQLAYSYNSSKREALKNAYIPDREGNYNVLDSTYSQSSRNESADQRASIAFKAQRSNYNYTVGFNVDPSYAKTETFVGDETVYSSSRNIVNYSPTIQFNYLPSQEKNLRIDYEGLTSQPTMKQLQPVEDVSDPLNTTVGNPDLKPIYTNNLRIRFQNFVREKQAAFMIFATAGYVVNDVVNYTTNDPNTGKRYTTYKNINGNYNGNARIIYNTPLRNKKFSVNNMAFALYSNANSYINTEKNTNKGLQLQDRFAINYRSDFADFELNGNISYRRTRNSLEGQTDLNTYNYGSGASTTLYLPYEFKIESDISYSTNTGYSDGYEQNEWLWNASFSKSFLKGNAATLRFKIYDILQQRSNISYTATSGYTRYSVFNTLNSYFMFHFIYRFSIFKGGASMSDMRGPGRPDGDGPGGGGPIRIMGPGGGPGGR